MSKGVNKVILIGNLGKDPETRYMPNGQAVTSFSIATSETWKDKTTGEQKESTEWHNCTAFRKLAEIIGEYCKKGSKVYVEGKLKTDKYEKDGGIKYYTKIVVDNLQMLDSRQESKSETAPQGDPDFDDQIPF